jgi:hypothetical protein
MRSSVQGEQTESDLACCPTISGLLYEDRETLPGYKWQQGHLKDMRLGLLYLTGCIEYFSSIFHYKMSDNSCKLFGMWLKIMDAIGNAYKRSMPFVCC